jgi:cytidylate kinase
VDWRSADFSNYTKIIVSGPQRSGTTWFASALARHLNYTHIFDE